MIFSRCDFVRMSLGSICASALPSYGAAPPERMKAVLLHLGRNMWCDWVRPGEPTALHLGAGAPGAKLRVNETLWRRLTAHMAKLRLNTLVVDIGEAVRLPSHPKLAVADAWSPESQKETPMPMAGWFRA